MSQPTVYLTPLRPALPRTPHDVDLPVLVRIRVPEAVGERPGRSPLNLALVLDRSGSMAGKPLAEAKRCAHHVVRALSPSDRCALVAYDDGVQLLCDAVPVADRQHLHRLIDTIGEGGSTNLHGGWEAGAAALRPHAAAQRLSRVVLLSDGCANVGVQSPDAIAEQCAALAAAGVSTSTYGLGSGFNELLMHRMAQAGQGNAYYGQTADDLMTPFNEELSLLDMLCGRDVRLTVTPASGVSVTMVNNLTSRGPASWQLPDLAHGAETWALLRLRVPAAAGDAPQALLTVQVQYTDLQGVPVPLDAVSLALPRVAEAVFAALAIDDTVQQRVDELAVAGAAQQAREAVMNGDWTLATRLLADMESRVSGNPWLAGVLSELRQLVAQRDDRLYGKEALYSSVRLHMRHASLSESSDLDLEQQKAAFLRRKASQGRSRPPR